MGKYFSDTEYEYAKTKWIATINEGKEFCGGQGRKQQEKLEKTVGTTDTQHCRS